MAFIKFFMSALSLTSLVAVAQDTRDTVDRRHLAEVNSVLESRGDQLGVGERNVLELFKMSVEARLDEDDTLECRSLHYLYLCSKEENNRGASILIDEFGFDCSSIPDRISMVAAQSQTATLEERLAAVEAVSLDVPDSAAVGRALIGIMEEGYEYEEIIDYCEKRMALGHVYFRLLRAKIRVHEQLEHNHIALKQKYGSNVEDTVELIYDLYSPELKEQTLSLEAVDEIRAILQLTGGTYVLDCSDVVLLAYAVSWLERDEVINLLELCIEQIPRDFGSDSGDGLVKYMENMVDVVISLPPDSGRFVDIRENMGDGKARHFAARQAGRLISTPYVGSHKIPDPTATNTESTEAPTRVDVGSIE